MSMSNTPTFWHIPYQRNPFFTGREDVLNQLHRALYAEHIVALSHPQGISGLGGIGKTQVALEYAYRYRTDYDAIFWVRADSVTSLTSSLIELAHILELPECDEQDQEIIVQSVLHWFRLHSDWLLIYDNIDDFSIAEPFLPKAGPGHLLFTTRAHALAGLAQRLDVKKMEPEIGALLLLRRASLLTTQATLDMANPDEQSIACTISQELDGLPLAIDQAGAYIKEALCPLSDYLTRYQTRRSNILHMRGSFNQNYPASVATTWSLSFEKVSRANPAAAELLNFCAFLAPDAILETIITEGSPHLGPVLSPIVTNPMQLDQAYKEVLRFSLLQRESDTCTLTIHRLVQAILRDSMSAETQQQWMQRAIHIIAVAFPDSDFANWATLGYLLPHALTCTTWIDQKAPFARFEAWRLLNRAGYYLSDRGRYKEAEQLHQRALAISEQEATYPDTAVSFKNSTTLYYDQERYGEEELEAMHPDTAASLNNLATVYQNQGRYREAEPLYQRAISITEQMLGAMNPAMASGLNNLAVLYHSLGRYGEAEQLYQRALAIREQLSGATHPNTAQSLGNLAALYHDQGRDREAEPLYQRALEIREQQLGATHPDTAAGLNNLATLYENQRRYEEAEPLYQRALAICEQQLGATHPDTTTSLNGLATLYYHQRRYEEAEPLYQRVLAICEQQLGATHPKTATSLNGLATLYKIQRRYKDAESLHRRALSIREQQLGPQHPDVAQSLNNLAALYAAQERYREAEPLCQRALAIREHILGATHPDTAQSLNNLAALYADQERYEEARPLYERVLAICQQELGDAHPDTANSLNSLATLYDNQGKYREAELLYERALTIRQQELGATHPDTAQSLNNLAALYADQERYEEAKPLYESALAICELLWGAEHPNTQHVKKNYKSLLQAMKHNREGE